MEDYSITKVVDFLSRVDYEQLEKAEEDEEQ
jgi:hypothetical protein